MITFSNIVKTEAANYVEPVSLQEAKDWAQIDFDDFDEMLVGMIKGARQTIEDFLGWKLVSTTITLDMENPGEFSDWLPLPYSRGVSTVVVNELDDDDVATLQVAADDYYLRSNTLRIYTGRYAVSYVSVPGVIQEPIKEAIKMEVAHRFAHRGENNAEGKGELSDAAKDRLYQYQVRWL